MPYLTPAEREEIVSLALERALWVDHEPVLLPGDKDQIATKFGRARRTVERLWQRAKKNYREIGIYTAPSLKKGKSGRRRKHMQGLSDNNNSNSDNNSNLLMTPAATTTPPVPYAAAMPPLRDNSLALTGVGGANSYGTYLYGMPYFGSVVPGMPMGAAGVPPAAKKARIDSAEKDDIQNEQPNNYLKPFQFEGSDANHKDDDGEDEEDEDNRKPAARPRPEQIQGYHQESNEIPRRLPDVDAADVVNVDECDMCDERKDNSSAVLLSSDSEDDRITNVAEDHNQPSIKQEDLPPNGVEAVEVWLRTHTPHIGERFITKYAQVLVADCFDSPYIIENFLTMEHLNDLKDIGVGHKLYLIGVIKGKK